MDMLMGNPADKVDLPKLEKYRANFYSKEEINHLLKVFEGDRLELVVNIAAYYGLRRSEIIGLKWDAIDFDKGTLTVCRKITSIFEDGHEQLRIDENLKTEASVRTLPLIPHIEKMLKKRMMLEMQYSQILKSDFDRTFDGFILSALCSTKPTASVSRKTLRDDGLSMLSREILAVMVADCPERRWWL